MTCHACRRENKRLRAELDAVHGIARKQVESMANVLDGLTLNEAAVVIAELAARLDDETEQREMHAVSIREYYAPGLATADTEIDRLISENHGVEAERDKLREALQSLYDWHSAVGGRYERQYRDAVREAEKALRSSPGEPADRDKLREENTRLRAFRDSVFAGMHEDAGNLVNPFAYMPQEEWNKIKAAQAAERSE